VSDRPAAVVTEAAVAPSPVLDAEPAGERYFRHPGDVVRLIVWLAVTVVLALFIEIATATSDGVSRDLGQAAGNISRAVRELVLAVTQVLALAVPIAVVGVLLVQRRFRRLGVLVFAAALGAGATALLDAWLDLSDRARGAVTAGTWIADPDFPSLVYLGAVAAVVAVGKPWLNRSWRRAADASLVALTVVLAVVGTAGLPELLVGVAAGITMGSAVLVAFGAPNRRASPAMVGQGLRDAGLAVGGLTLQRADGGRAQLYEAMLDDGRRLFVKVYGRDRRDADLLYRAYRTAILRGTTDWPAPELERDVEHEALLALLARRGNVTTPSVEALAQLPDASVVLAFDLVDGTRVDELPDSELTPRLLDEMWGEVAKLHAARIAHRSLRAANILAFDGHPMIIDFGFAVESATERLQAIDRAELLTSLATLVGVDAAVDSSLRVIGPVALAAALPYLQPLALTRATRSGASKKLLHELRDRITDATGVEPEPLEQLVRVRPRTLVMIAALTAAFYVLLPQLADVGDSVDALQDADWWWLVVCVVMSFGTYVAAAIGMSGAVRVRLPFVPNLGAQFASSFVNRVTPANVGGMALNVRFLQKAGVDSAQALTGIGLNVAAGGVAHVVLLLAFFAWAGRSDSNAFQIPSTSRILVVIAAVLAVVGLVALTRWGRRILRTHVLGFLRNSWSSLVVLGRSPAKLALLLGGSTFVTIFYVCALAAAVAAFNGDVSFAQVGAVYLGASVIAAAAPTPGGLGALEAALVAGLTGVGMESGPAVAAVLGYRLLTYWLPVLPGWLSFQLLERKEWI
jgi:undecaprenyl-diphosphatase